MAGHLDRQLINIVVMSGAAAPLCFLSQRPKGRCRAALVGWRVRDGEPMPSLTAQRWSRLQHGNGQMVTLPVVPSFGGITHTWHNGFLGSKAVEEMWIRAEVGSG